MTDSTAAKVISLLAERGETFAVAESLTGGLIGATVTGVAGSSAAFVGGVISYATDVKARLLGVPAELLAREGAVHPDVAAAMAAGVRKLTGATWAVAVTGVAGPEPQDGRPVGTVFCGLSGPGDVSKVVDLRLTGDRQAIRIHTCEMALDLLLGVVLANSGEHSG
ncbi:CinA family protein [Herbidospora daliensis]|uniref:CinA family protein n=1 Tax=Herbidospora daliensis TaxID=295585 RepID=UPI000781B9B2|nr:nicotinamide-nucleotide amidohydrolase family protein [Herbidospora daliensis]